MWTISDTNVTTTIITAVSLSIRKPTCAETWPTSNQVYTSWLYGAAPSSTSIFNTQNDSAHEVATPRIVTQCAPARPMRRPNRPATIAPSNGASAMVRRMGWVITGISSLRSCSYKMRSSVVPPDRAQSARSALHGVDFADVDRVPVAEQRDDDCK